MPIIYNYSFKRFSILGSFSGTSKLGENVRTKLRALKVDINVLMIVHSYLRKVVLSKAILTAVSKPYRPCKLKT